MYVCIYTYICIYIYIIHIYSANPIHISNTNLYIYTCSHDTPHYMWCSAWRISKHGGAQRTCGTECCAVHSINVTNDHATCNNMCICVCVYINICVYIYIHNLYTIIYIYIYIYTYTSLSLYIHIYISISISLSLSIYIYI